MVKGDEEKDRATVVGLSKARCKLQNAIVDGELVWSWDFKG
jgi:hypothetical protein